MLAAPALPDAAPVVVPDSSGVATAAPAAVNGAAWVPAQGVGPGDGVGWEGALQAEAQALLASGRTDVWEELVRRFESRLILTALGTTRGRRIEAAQKLGIGRNTITRKIQELGLE